MSWMLVAAGTGVAAGAVSGYEKKKAQKRQQLAQSEVTRYSPLTGMQGQIVPEAPSMFSSMLGGAATGIGMGKSLGAGGAQAPQSPAVGTNMSTQTGAGTQWQNMMNPGKQKIYS